MSNCLFTLLNISVLFFGFGQRFLIAKGTNNIKLIYGISTGFDLKNIIILF